MQSLFSLTAGASVRWHDLPGQGIPVVFIHGLGCASSYEYPRIVADPAFGERRTILIDLPGYGFSDKPRDYDYSIAHQADVVIEVVNALELTQCHIYGHSMGGSIAIEVAKQLRERVCKLVVSEPNFHAGGGIYSRLLVEKPEAEFISQVYDNILANHTSPWKGSAQNAAPWAMWRGAKSLIDGTSPSWMEIFLNLSCSRTLIFGEQSLPDSDFQCVNQKGISVAIVPEAGHSMSWENPSALATVLHEEFSEGSSQLKVVE
ncbi:alpha/beta hydrolase [Salmonella enterica]|nr:alpha/beta hydrolase [Salmonella enterica]EDN4904051.1 alpha/beta hydrolase [Salmonella enterica subsp. enterica serovar Saintpaul]EJP4194866.1 alpha/beta hydrolase [Salmonella enterica subsp. enterica serovar Schwarzengrund]EKA9942467.1 alpha/beta hydrolase [Salmonella enterica subsp. enterica serovar Braenderup]EAY1194443.1 alpha/beta hydrolase [Salmonella enterica]